MVIRGRTEAEVSDGLHLTQVPGPPVDDASVGAVLLGVQHHLGPSGEGPELGPRYNAQPGVTNPLRETHTHTHTHAHTHMHTHIESRRAGRAVSICYYSHPL